MITFKNYSYFSGHNASILHYGHAGAPNDKLIRDGDMWYDQYLGSYYPIHLDYSFEISCWCNLIISF